MYKRIFLLVLIFLTAFQNFSQQTILDKNELLENLRDAKTKMDRVDAWNSLAFYFRFASSDSALFYSYKAHNLAVQTGYRIGELRALHNMSVSHLTVGNIAESLSICLEGKKKSEDYNEREWIARFLNGIGISYCLGGNPITALDNLFIASHIFRELDLCNTAVTESWIGVSYAMNYQLDSALHYGYLGLKESQQPNCLGDLLTFPLLHLATLHRNLNNLDSSLYYSRLLLSKEVRNTRFRSDAALEIAKCHLASGQRDSSQIYADLAFDVAMSTRLYPQIINACLFYEEFFETIDLSSSLKFGREARLYKDSLEQLQYKTTIGGITEYDAYLRNTELKNARKAIKNNWIQYSLLTGILFVALVALILRNGNKQKERINRSLSAALDSLKATQTQLIHSEKMASLGELTAGIAHEIQNPLNFVNNFSDLNAELIEDLKAEAKAGNMKEVDAILNDISENEQKIHHHGKRAEGIVRSMLQHSRTGTGEKQLTDINALCDEYLRLAYHGMRAKDKSFNAEFKTDLDPNLPKIEVVPQDIGRVLLNLINNAFQACSEGGNEKPRLRLKTEYLTKPEETSAPSIEISISDNGPGIPSDIKDKIFQPFFTTKPTGQGTGLGLSLSYDIVKAYGGAIEVETEEGEGSIFIISLPVQ